MRAADLSGCWQGHPLPCVHLYLPGEAERSGLASFVFLCSKLFLFSCSEVSTLKDLFGLASNGRHCLRSLCVSLVMSVGLVDLGV